MKDRLNQEYVINRFIKKFNAKKMSSEDEIAWQ